MASVRSDEESFEALFTAEYARVAGIANRVLADPHEAEDVAQEVFIDFHRLHSASAQYAPAWLHRAAAHAALNRLRGDRRQVRQALARLAPRPAAVLVLRASGLSYAEVAQALGVGIGQVGTLLRRAEAALRKEIGRGTSI